jgi:nicotinate-nucleotide adenylyltransferase
MPSRWSRGRGAVPDENDPVSVHDASARHLPVAAMSRSIRVLAILGGTFDPIHYGHLRLAAEVKAALGLPEVRLIPAGNPPHRDAPVASGADRLAMTRLGCGEFAGLAVDEREIERAGPSYTVQTLEALHAEQPALPLALLIGADAFAGLTQWWRWERLFTLAHFVVVERPGAAAAALPPALEVHWQRRLTTDPARLERTLAGSIVRVEVTPQPIAASAIRAALARGPEGRAEVRGLLPAAVLDYIDHNQLYLPPSPQEP